MNIIQEVGDKMTDYEKLIKLFNDFGIEYGEHTEKIWLHQDCESEVKTINPNGDKVFDYGLFSSRYFFSLDGEFLHLEIYE